MLEIKNLTKRYKDNQVYTDFSFTASDGEITCILGESGSGKTTLLNCIAGITDYSGSISYSNTSCGSMPCGNMPSGTISASNSPAYNKSSGSTSAAEQEKDKDKHTCRCSYIFQYPRLVPSLTVLGNLKLVCPDEGRIIQMLDAVGLTGREKSYPGKLSGGQQQRVAIARAFLYDADIILMDEPFSSLDLRTKDEMAKLFFSIWEREKRTVLFVTHSADDAIAMAHRIVVLKDSRLCLDIPLPGRPPRDIGACETERVALVKALMEP